MKPITHPVAIKLIRGVIDRIPIYKTGTYNRADPTHFEKGEHDMEFENDWIQIETHDCTWGVTLRIKSCQGPEKEIYLDRGCFGGKDELIPRESWKPGDLLYLRRLLPHLPELEIEDDDHYWVDPAGGIHYPGEVDPARQYE